MRLSARGTQRLTYQLRFALGPECLKDPTNHHQEEFQGWNGLPEALKLFVVSNIWRRSELFRPDRQSDRSNLAGQSQARHLRLDPLANQRLVKLMKAMTAL